MSTLLAQNWEVALCFAGEADGAGAGQQDRGCLFQSGALASKPSNFKACVRSQRGPGFEGAASARASAAAGQRCVGVGGPHACCSSKGAQNTMTCEAWDEKCCLKADTTNCCWRCDVASYRACHCSGCGPCSLIYARSQAGCIYARYALPTTDDAPCEIGCCGVFCLSKANQIQNSTKCLSRCAEYQMDQCPTCRRHHLLDPKSLKKRFAEFRSGYQKWRTGAPTGARGEVGAATTARAPAPPPHRAISGTKHGYGDEAGQADDAPLATKKHKLADVPLEDAFFDASASEANPADALESFLTRLDVLKHAPKTPRSSTPRSKADEALDQVDMSIFELFSCDDGADYLYDYGADVPRSGAGKTTALLARLKAEPRPQRRAPPPKVRVEPPVAVQPQQPVGDDVDTVITKSLASAGSDDDESYSSSSSSVAAPSRSACMTRTQHKKKTQRHAPAPHRAAATKPVPQRANVHKQRAACTGGDQGALLTVSTISYLGTNKLQRLAELGITTVKHLANIDPTDRSFAVLATRNSRPDRACRTLREWRNKARDLLRSEEKNA
ncbi:hypothetical protein M885DRAFT_604899 [Pelagophyceae sp. CCMP2097]|nr:hypothetical protein M885DRAFT_604899 [Pelagophyceae sp. CCMP2097]